MLGETVRPLVVIETHPIQYHAPVYREVQGRFGVPVTVIYGSDCSVVGYQDKEFGASFRWDTDLLSGYESMFLSRVGQDLEIKNRTLIFGIRKALQRLQPAAVLLVGYSPMFHQIAFLAARQSGVPILFRGETTDHAKSRETLRTLLRSRALRLLYQRCARLLYVGRHSQEHYERLLVPAAKLVFSPYCVNEKVFRTTERDRRELREETRERLGIRTQETALLFSGKLSVRKGPDLLLSALKSLAPEIRERIVVLFLGSGSEQPALEALAKQRPEIKGRFLGFQNQQQLSPYYHAADVLVLPSRHSETWGLVVNEALHHGLPCVVSQAVGCAPDLMDAGVTGELFETDSDDSLSAALLRALRLVGRLDIREFCRNKVSGYTVEKAAEGIANAYRDVARTQTIALCENKG